MYNHTYLIQIFSGSGKSYNEYDILLLIFFFANIVSNLKEINFRKIKKGHANIAGMAGPRMHVDFPFFGYIMGMPNKIMRSVYNMLAACQMNINTLVETFCFNLLRFALIY